ncbi:MAG: hypothetical protein OXU20_26380 [Myxococcales bacterium]|nr:hypothetical protein [Myxococcales bacterium]
MEWTEMMAKRDRVQALLRPHLGRDRARERANDIVQAFVFSDGDPAALARRMLARDLEPRAAEVVAFQLGRTWQLPLQDPALPSRPVLVTASHGRPGDHDEDPEPHAPGIARRRRRETVIIGLWH